jgi:hypothetical protein
MAKQIKLSFATFAHDLGAHTRITLEVSEVWHAEFLSADEVTRKARREEFILNFLIGYGCKNPEAIMSQSRDERTADDQKVYDAARAKFTYHVVRPEKSSGSAKADPVAKALALVESMTPAQKKRFLAAL